jgi:hypothetical protein
MFTGFPWNPAAAALAPTPLVTITALIGTYGLSGLLVLLGGAIWLEYRRQWLPLVLIVAATTLLWLLPASAVPPDPLTVRNLRIVQPNIGQEDKWRPGFDEEAARRLALLSGRPGEPRLLLWPEAAVTDPREDARSDEHQAFAEFRRTRAASLLAPNDRLLTGGIAVASRDGVHVSAAANRLFALAPGGKLIGRYTAETPQKEGLCCNDLVITSGGDVYVTSGPNGIFVLRKGKDHLERVPSPGQSFFNGIALADDKTLFAADALRGVMRLDLPSAKWSTIQLPADLTLSGIDGLYFTNGSLVAIQNAVPQAGARVVQAWLSPDRSRVVRHALLERRHPLYDVPTTGVVVGSSLFYIANSQLDSFSEKKIWPAEKLERTYVLELPLGKR